MSIDMTATSRLNRDAPATAWALRTAKMHPNVRGNMLLALFLAAGHCEWALRHGDGYNGTSVATLRDACSESENSLAAGLRKLAAHGHLNVMHTEDGPIYRIPQHVFDEANEPG